MQHLQFLASSQTWITITGLSGREYKITLKYSMSMALHLLTRTTYVISHGTYLCLSYEVYKCKDANCSSSVQIMNASMLLYLWSQMLLPQVKPNGISLWPTCQPLYHRLMRKTVNNTPKKAESLKYWWTQNTSTFLLVPFSARWRRDSVRVWASGWASNNVVFVATSWSLCLWGISCLVFIVSIC